MTSLPNGYTNPAYNPFANAVPQPTYQPPAPTPVYISRELDGMNDTGVLGQVLTEGTAQVSKTNQYFLNEFYKTTGLLSRNQYLASDAAILTGKYAQDVLSDDDMYVAGDPLTGGRGNNYQPIEITPATGYYTMLADGLGADAQGNPVAYDGSERHVLINAHVAEISKDATTGASNTAFTEYGFVVGSEFDGETQAILSGGQLTLTNAKGESRVLKPGEEYIVGDPLDPTAKFFYAEKPGGENNTTETRLVFEYYEKPTAKTLQQLVEKGIPEAEAKRLRTTTQATFGFRYPDGGNTYRYAAGNLDLDGNGQSEAVTQTANGVGTYYDAHFSEGKRSVQQIVPAVPYDIPDETPYPVYPTPPVTPEPPVYQTPPAPTYPPPPPYYPPQQVMQYACQQVPALAYLPMVSTVMKPFMSWMPDYSAYAAMSAYGMGGNGLGYNTGYDMGYGMGPGYPGFGMNHPFNTLPVSPWGSVGNLPFPGGAMGGIGSSFQPALSSGSRMAAVFLPMMLKVMNSLMDQLMEMSRQLASNNTQTTTSNALTGLNTPNTFDDWFEQWLQNWENSWQNQLAGNLGDNSTPFDAFIDPFSPTATGTADQSATLLNALNGLNDALSQFNPAFTRPSSLGGGLGNVTESPNTASDNTSFNALNPDIWWSNPFDAWFNPSAPAEQMQQIITQALNSVRPATSNNSSGSGWNNLAQGFPMQRPAAMWQHPSWASMGVTRPTMWGSPYGGGGYQPLPQMVPIPVPVPVPIRPMVQWLPETTVQMVPVQVPSGYPGYPVSPGYPGGCTPAQPPVGHFPPPPPPPPVYQYPPLPPIPQEPPIYPPPPVIQPPPPPPPPVFEYPQYPGDGNNTGNIYGDPHFTGFDGGKYDVQGESGKVYNLITDQRMQVNARFDTYWKHAEREANGDSYATVMTQVGMKLGEDKVFYDVRKNEAPTVNGVALEKGKEVPLDNGTGSALWNENGTITLKGDGFNLVIKPSSPGNTETGYINIDASMVGTDQFKDYVMPHGILGQTADGDGEARNGVQGAGKQGGGVLDIIDDQGNVVRSDRENLTAHTFYEIKNQTDAGEPDIFGDDFAFNRFGVAPEKVLAWDEDGDGTWEVLRAYGPDGKVIYQKPKTDVDAVADQARTFNV